jgi:aldehyde dehydrogenase (NAD+)/betaine-aldehyde dehydrogenase
MDGNFVAGRQGVRTSLLVDNADRAGEGERLSVVNPATEAVVAGFQGASVAQANEAACCARAAFASGAWRDPEFRRATLHKFATLIEESRDSLMETLIAEVGTPINLKANHIDTPAAFLRWFAEAAVRDRTRHLGFNVANTGSARSLTGPSAWWRRSPRSTTPS